MRPFPGNAFTVSQRCSNVDAQACAGHGLGSVQAMPLKRVQVHDLTL